jgi:hypothetical protein
MRKKSRKATTRQGRLQISRSKKKQIAALAIILAASIFLSPLLTAKSPTAYVTAKPGCNNECSYSGEKQCDGSLLKTCGYYDSDACLDLDSGLACGHGCSAGKCLPLVQSQVQEDKFWQKEKCEPWCADYATKYYPWETVCTWYPGCKGCSQCGGNL